MNAAEDLIGIDERNRSEKDMNYRATGIRGPETLDRENRSLEFVVTTETPVLMWDWDRMEYVNEVLLAKGMSMPKQVPLLDTHSRYSVSSVLGSVRNRVVEEDSRLVSATARFSSVKEGEDALTKYEEGHLTDFSAGYRNNAITHVKKGEIAEIGGRSYKGPVNVVTSWTLREVSCCPIGADPHAKVRSDNTKKHTSGETEMNEDDKKILSDIAEGTKKTNEALSALVEKFNPVIDALGKKSAIEDEEKSVETMRKETIAKRHLTIENERKRLLEIDKMCERFDIDDDFRAQLIEDGSDVNKARELIMERISARTDGNISIKVGREDRDKVRQGITEGILLRAGIATDKIEDKNNPYRGYTMTEMAREVLRMNNLEVPTTKTEIFKRALSTDDFDNIMADVAQKALNDGFEKADETYSIWVDTSGVLNDYKGHQFSRASEAPSLQSKNPEGGEYEYGKLSDTWETVTAADYGIIVPFTKAAMINDDLGALDDIRTKLGEAAARKWGDLVYAVLTTGATAYTMGDGVLLFDQATHANYEIEGSLPTAITINNGFTAMATQKDLQGLQTLNIRPEYLIAPWNLKGTVDALLHSTAPVVVGTNTVNPMPGGVAVYDARLDTFSIHGWFLAARKGKTVKLFTLNGQLTPNLTSKMDWTTDNMDFKCDIAGAAAAMDYRGLYYNDGA